MRRFIGAVMGLLLSCPSLAFDSMDELLTAPLEVLGGAANSFVVAMRSRLPPDDLHEDRQKTPMPPFLGLVPQSDDEPSLSLKVLCDLPTAHVKHLPPAIQASLGGGLTVLQFAMGVLKGEGVCPLDVMPYALSGEKGAPFEARVRVWRGKALEVMTSIEGLYRPHPEHPKQLVPPAGAAIELSTASPQLIFLKGEIPDVRRPFFRGASQLVTIYLALPGSGFSLEKGMLGGQPFAAFLDHMQQFHTIDMYEGALDLSDVDVDVGIVESAGGGGEGGGGEAEEASGSGEAKPGESGPLWSRPLGYVLETLFEKVPYVLPWKHRYAPCVVKGPLLKTTQELLQLNPTMPLFLGRVWQEVSGGIFSLAAHVKRLPSDRPMKLIDGGDSIYYPYPIPPDGNCALYCLGLYDREAMIQGVMDYLGKNPDKKSLLLPEIHEQIMVFGYGAGVEGFDNYRRAYTEENAYHETALATLMNIEKIRAYITHEYISGRRFLGFVPAYEGVHATPSLMDLLAHMTQQSIQIYRLSGDGMECALMASIDVPSPRRVVRMLFAQGMAEHFDLLLPSPTPIMLPPAIEIFKEMSSERLDTIKNLKEMLQNGAELGFDAAKMQSFKNQAAAEVACEPRLKDFFEGLGGV